jgi:hypothetical protein
VAVAGDREGLRVDRSQDVEIDKAIVEWRNQRIGHRMRESRQVGVGARRVDDHEVVAVFDRGDGLREA